MISILIAVAAVTLLYFRFFRDVIRRATLLSKFPGPPTVPLLGNALDFTNSIEAMPKMQEFIKKYGDVIHVSLGPFLHTIIVADPKSFEFFLGSTKILDKARGYSFLHRWLGQGLLTSTGNKWRTHRKMLTPTFHFKILEDFIDVFNSVGNVMVKKLEKEVGKQLVNIYPYVTLCTLDIICETAMGVSVNAQSNSDSDYVKSVKEMCRLLVVRDQSIIKTFEPTYKLTKDYQSELNCLKVLHGFTKDIIAKRTKELESKNSEEEKDEYGLKKRHTFLDLLLKMKDADGRRALSDVDIREEVDTFMFEGHDTTASAISFILYNLANNQEAQEKVVRELEAIFGNDDERTATYNDLQEMKYLDCVVKESLRLYPSVPLIGRKTVEDVEFFGKTIPSNTTVGIFIYGIQRDERFFPDALKFNPERFLEMEKENPFVYVPFSAGSRNCIGQKFAMLEMKATVSKVLRKFKLSPATPNEEPILVFEAVLKSANGINLRLEQRTY
nr:cytochrome P450 monooxygenase CYP4SS3 [Lasioderma serricorne]